MALHRQLNAAKDKLEAELKSVVDFSFTVEEGRLYILDARPARLTPIARLVSAVEMVGEGIISPADAVCQLEKHGVLPAIRRTIVDEIRHHRFRAEVARGIGVGGHTAVGRWTTYAVSVLTAETPTVLALAELDRSASLDFLEETPVAALVVGDMRLGGTSITASRARNLGLPAVFRVGTLPEIPEGTEVLVDGLRGLVLARTAPDSYIPPVAALAPEIQQLIIYWGLVRTWAAANCAPMDHIHTTSRNRFP